MSYLSRVRDLQSDLVISLDGHNEQFNSEYEKYTPFADMRDAWEYHPQRTNPVTRIGMYLMGKSYTFFYVGKKIFTTGFFRINPDDPFDQSFYDQWKKRTPHIDNNRLDSLFHARNVNIDAACKELLYQYDVFDAVLTLDNVPHAFLSQPLLALKAHRTEMEEVLYNYLYSPDFWIEERTLWYLRSYPYFLSLLAAHMREKGIQWMNLQEYVDATQEQVFIDYCHFSKEGNAYLAKGIADFITTRGLLKIQP